MEIAVRLRVIADERNKAMLRELQKKLRKLESRRPPQETEDERM
jgi:hypothetical protein